MIVRLGGMISQASGTLGALQFTSGRTAPTVKMRRVSSNQSTPDQLDHQAAHATAAAAWNALTDAHKFAWKLYALKQVRQNRLGVARQLTPFQLFMGQNTLRAQVGAPLRTGPPKYGMTGVGTPAFIGFTSGGSYRVYMIAPSTDTVGYYVIYGHRPVSTTHTGRVFKHVVYSGACTTSIDVDISATWDAKLGPMASTEKYWIAVRYLGDNSLASAPIALTGTVA
jgi:hypothetical protein